MAAHSLPAFYLSRIIRMSAAHVVPAVPLEPSAWIVRMDPSFHLPHRKRLRRVHAKVVQLLQVLFCTHGRKLRTFEPRLRKFVRAVTHVDASEYAKGKHFCGCQFRFEFGIKVAPFGRD